MKQKKRKRLLIVGCGGVGGWVVRMLASTHEFALADGDRVEEKNLDRQLFSPAQIGMNKAEAMAAYAESLPGSVPVKDIFPGYFTPDQRFRIDVDAVVCCVDNFKGMASVLAYGDRMGFPVILAANEKLSASASIYLPDWQDGPRDPRMVFPEINTDNTADDPLTPHCHALVSSGEQTPYANMAAALAAVSLVLTWIDDGIAEQIDEIRNQVCHRHEMTPATWRSCK